MPGYQPGERHSVFVDAPPERVFESLKRAKGDEHPVVKLFDLLPVIAGKRDAASLSEDGKPLYGVLRETSGLVVERPGTADRKHRDRGRAHPFPLRTPCAGSSPTD